MDGYYGYQLLLIAIIVIVNSFFAGAEVSLVSSRVSRLRALADEGVVGAQAALSLLANPEKLLSVTQVGVTLSSLALGSAGDQTFHDILRKLFGISPPISSNMDRVLDGLSFVMAYAVMTFLHVVIGEVVPKNIAIETTDRLAVLVAPPLLVFYRVVSPFVFTLERSSAWLSKAIGLKSGGHLSAHSAEELRFILTASERDGVLPPFTGKAMQRLIDLEDYLTREIMVPRNQTVAVALDTPLDQLVRIVNEHQFSRVPIHDGRPEQIIGYVHSKDLLRVWQDRQLATASGRAIRPFEIRRIMRKLPIVPESKPVIQLLDEFRKNHCHIAQVVDEFGTFTGVVTLEDVVEQIFGEIEDEHDLRRPAAQSPGAAVLHLDGSVPIRDLATQYGIALPAEAGYETLAGFLLFRLGRIPSNGDHVEEGRRRYVVEEMARNRIARVRVEQV